MTMDVIELLLKMGFSVVGIGVILLVIGLLADIISGH